MSLTTRQRDALRRLLATIPAAVYVPTSGHIYCCPRWPGLHHCPATLDAPAAVQLAAYLAETAGTEAHVLVYGVPWVDR